MYSPSSSRSGRSGSAAVEELRATSVKVENWSPLGGVTRSVPPPSHALSPPITMVRVDTFHSAAWPSSSSSPPRSASWSSASSSEVGGWRKEDDDPEWWDGRERRHHPILGPALHRTSSKYAEGSADGQRRTLSSPLLWDSLARLAPILSKTERENTSPERYASPSPSSLARSQAKYGLFYFLYHLSWKHFSIFGYFKKTKTTASPPRTKDASLCRECEELLQELLWKAQHAWRTAEEEHVIAFQQLGHGQQVDEANPSPLGEEWGPPSRGRSRHSHPDEKSSSRGPSSFVTRCPSCFTERGHALPFPLPRLTSTSRMATPPMTAFPFPLSIPDAFPYDVVSFSSLAEVEEEKPSLLNSVEVLKTTWEQLLASSLCLCSSCRERFWRRLQRMLVAQLHGIPHPFNPVQKEEKGRARPLGAKKKIEDAYRDPSSPPPPSSWRRLPSAARPTRTREQDGKRGSPRPRKSAGHPQRSFSSLPQKGAQRARKGTPRSSLGVFKSPVASSLRHSSIPRMPSFPYHKGKKTKATPFRKGNAKVWMAKYGASPEEKSWPSLPPTSGDAQRRSEEVFSSSFGFPPAPPPSVSFHPYHTKVPFSSPAPPQGIPLPNSTTRSAMPVLDVVSIAPVNTIRNAHGAIPALASFSRDTKRKGSTTENKTPLHQQDVVLRRRPEASKVRSTGNTHEEAKQSQPLSSDTSFSVPRVRTPRPLPFSFSPSQSFCNHLASGTPSLASVANEKEPSSPAKDSVPSPEYGTEGAVGTPVRPSSFSTESRPTGLQFIDKGEEALAYLLQTFALHRISEVEDSPVPSHRRSSKRSSHAGEEWSIVSRVCVPVREERRGSPEGSSSSRFPMSHRQPASSSPKKEPLHVSKREAEEMERKRTIATEGTTYSIGDAPSEGDGIHTPVARRLELVQGKHSYPLSSSFYRFSDGSLGQEGSHLMLTSADLTLNSEGGKSESTVTDDLHGLKQVLSPIIVFPAGGVDAVSAQCYDGSSIALHKYE